jgi:hypothetical protein
LEIQDPPKLWDLMRSLGRASRVPEGEEKRKKMEPWEVSIY